MSGGAIKAYASVFLLRLRVELQYRAAALGGLITQVFFGLILIALYRALYAYRPQELPLDQVVTYVWIQQACFRLLLSSDGELLETVRTGGMAYELCRPLSPYAFYYARAAAQKLVGSLLRAVPMLALAFCLPAGWRMGSPAGLWQLLVALAGVGLGLLCVCALDNIAMAFTIRSLDNRGISNAMNLLLLAFSGNLLPLTLFPESWQAVIRLTPYAQLLDAPIRIYTGQYGLAEAAGALALQAGWIVLLALAGLALWRVNQKRMIVQGG